MLKLCTDSLSFLRQVAFEGTDRVYLARPLFNANLRLAGLLPELSRQLVCNGNPPGGAIG